MNHWNAEDYDKLYSVVWEKGVDMVALLDPKPSERILDLGCGTGHLTNKIAETGASVVGMDASASMIAQAKELYPSIEFTVGNGASFSFDRPFDGIFSNAALHWIEDAEGAVRSMAAALKPGGRLVAELGGSGNVAKILAAAEKALSRRQYDVRDLNPWYFPSIAEYASLLEKYEIETRSAVLFDRPTPVEGDMRDWMLMFGDEIMGRVKDEDREAILADINEQLRPVMFDGNGWTADYRRLRLTAVKL